MGAHELPSWYARQDELKAAWRRVPEAPWRYEAAREPTWLEITKASWYEALNVLPPMKWRRESGPETFILMEMWADGPKGPIAWMFAKSHERHYATLASVADYEEMRAKVPREPGPRASSEHPLVLHGSVPMHRLPPLAKHDGPRFSQITRAKDGFEGLDRGTRFRASYDLFLIREAWERGADYEDLADGFGAGAGTMGDWSSIRDSSPQAKALMLEVALNYLFDGAN